MPELPDIVVYMEALEQRVVGHVLENLEVRGPSLLRTADPPIYSIQDHRVTDLRRVGKRIAFGFDNDLWLVFHLMIAGRLHWSQKKKTADGRRTLAAFDFDNGTLTLTEAGTRKRASLHLVRGEADLAARATASRVRAAAPRSSAYAMRPMRPTIVRIARPPGSCWPTALSAACCATTGSALQKSWKNAAGLKWVPIKKTYHEGTETRR